MVAVYVSAIKLKAVETSVESGAKRIQGEEMRVPRRVAKAVTDF